jgi:hypothetical protein
MKRFEVTIKNEEYETFLVDAETAEAANQKVSAAMPDASLWNGRLPDIIAYSSGRGEYWKVDPELTEEIPMA